MSTFSTIVDNKQFITDTQDASAYEAPLRCGDFPVALPLLHVAIAQEDARAMGLYGALCATGQGVEKNLHEAYSWLRRGATRGDGPTQLLLGMFLIRGMGVPIDRTEAAYWLYRAGIAGNRQAINALEALSENDSSVVGPHFNEGQLIRLIYASRKSTWPIFLPERQHFGGIK